MTGTPHHPDLPCWLALRRAGLGTTNFTKLLAAFGDIGSAWDASTASLRAAGLTAPFVRSFEKARQQFDPEGEARLLAHHGLRVLTWLDEAYPPALRAIPQSPPVLYVRGSHHPGTSDGVAIVGTRRMTAYGRTATELFAGALADAGLTIVSGLARGHDSVAHRMAVEHGTPTIAVLAGGLDRVFPRENEGLARRIEEHGCLVSEYPPGIPARADYFPRRNRIIAGLSLAVLVVEAGRGSGALHTANWAFEQGRDVFAVPGAIFSKQSEATNQLIRENTARLVATPEQLFEELNLAGSLRAAPPAEPPRPVPEAPALAEQDTVAAPVAIAAPIGAPEAPAILELLGEAPVHVDEIVRATGLSTGAVTGTLQILELEGHVRQAAPLTYLRT
jgi:DNA processing protein